MEITTINHEDLIEGPMPAPKNAQEARELRAKIFKLGDKVHSVAQPIAKVIDKTLGTNIQGCGGCARRREKLNNLFNKDLTS